MAARNPVGQDRVQVTAIEQRGWGLVWHTSCTNSTLIIASQELYQGLTTQRFPNTYSDAWTLSFQRAMGKH